MSQESRCKREQTSHFIWAQPLVRQFWLHQISTCGNLIRGMFQGGGSIKSLVRYFWSVGLSTLLPQKYFCKMGWSVILMAERNWAMQLRHLALWRPKKNAHIYIYIERERARHRPSYNCYNWSTAEAQRRIKATDCWATMKIWRIAYVLCILTLQIFNPACWRGG